MPRTKISTGRNVSKTIKMSESHAERLERVCERLDISVNSYLLQALSRTLVADEGRIAQADMAENLRTDLMAMFQPVMDSLVEPDEKEVKADD